MNAQVSFIVVIPVLPTLIIIQSDHRPRNINWVLCSVKHIRDDHNIMWREREREMMMMMKFPKKISRPANLSRIHSQDINQLNQTKGVRMGYLLASLSLIIFYPGFYCCLIRLGLGCILLMKTTKVNILQ